MIKVKKYKSVKLIFIAALALTISQSAFSEGFTGVPVGWKLESYGPTTVFLWFTPSNCTNGSLSLSKEATVAEYNRLYATVTAAKVAKIEMFVYYKQVDSSCIITSFGLV
ncbi:hypothetical protein IFT68_22675 [Oxalobacteraceae sp. CFBP 13730]|nr:hypothetical protein [Oxalobacteraceae sp. CFBP 13730]